MARYSLYPQCRELRGLSRGLRRATDYSELHTSAMRCSASLGITQNISSRETLQTQSHLKPDLWSLDGKLDLLLEALRDVLIGRNLLFGYVVR
jgi:hypothetical protein